MDKRLLSIASMIGCLGFMALTLVSTIFMSKYIHWLPSLVICVMFYSAIFLFFLNILYNRGIEIRTAVLYDETENNFSDIQVDDSTNETPNPAESPEDSQKK